MKNLLYYFTLLIFITIFVAIIAGSQKQNPHHIFIKAPLQLPSSVLTFIEKVPEIAVSKVRALWGVAENYEIISNRLLLDEKRQEEILKILFQRESYLMEEKKTALFVPEYLLHLISKEGEELVILYNPTGRELEFHFQKKTQRVDCDPAFEKIEAILQGLEFNV